VAAVAVVVHHLVVDIAHLVVHNLALDHLTFSIFIKKWTFTYIKLFIGHNKK
jgi:hypothetical protein